MKKWQKVILGFIIGIASIWLIGEVLAKNYLSEKFAYENQVGYLSPANKDYHNSFNRCSDKAPVGYFSHTYGIFKVDKSVFRNTIISEFNQNNFTDNGILNLRFLISCKGDIGDVEINQLDFDFEKKQLNESLVEELVDLSFQKANWKQPYKEEAVDYYMYLIYRIENGKVVEILP